MYTSECTIWPQNFEICPHYIGATVDKPTVTPPLFMKFLIHLHSVHQQHYIQTLPNSVVGNLQYAPPLSLSHLTLEILCTSLDLQTLDVRNRTRLICWKIVDLSSGETKINWEIDWMRDWDKMDMMKRSLQKHYFKIINHLVNVNCR